MNYLVSGGMGFIGKNLCNRLDSLGESYHALDITAGCDLSKTDLYVDKCQTFVHLAALTNVRGSLRNPVDHLLYNYKLTVNCINYAKSRDAHFIMASSMGAPFALSPYAASKLGCEGICTAYREAYELDTTILRFSNVYGPHSIHKSSIIPKFIKACINREPLKIYGDGSQTRDFIYVDDVVDIILSCRGQKFLRVASGKPMSIIGLLNLIIHFSENLLCYKPTVVFQPFNKGEILKVESATDIVPKVGFYTGLSATFKWFIENYGHK